MSWRVIIPFNLMIKLIPSSCLREILHTVVLIVFFTLFCYPPLSKTSFQATVLPVIPGIMSRTTAIPSLGNLQDLYPETYGGVRFSCLHLK